MLYYKLCVWQKRQAIKACTTEVCCTAWPVLDIFECLNKIPCGRYYSIKKDKYCDGISTGHSLNVIGGRYMDSVIY